MSAIAGILNLNGEPVSIEHSAGMMKALEKFPANDIQTWHKDNLFLGCHAQWITPESIGEQLPFYDYERRLAITADAIIDNREELFQLLQIDREDQKKITDSQLILLAYHKWGEESPKFLIGDFAYVIWDEKEQKLFGARDFSGSRTLYYFKDGQRFVFCSIINPFFELPTIKKELNELWLAEYLAIPNMIDTVDTEATVYRNIVQLPPSHCVTIHNGDIRKTRYHSFSFDKKLKLNDYKEYEYAFREVIDRSVKDRLRSIKQVGAHLSGGLDSGTIVSFASKNLKKQGKVLHTFSYVPEKDFIDWTPKYRIADERPYIKSTVDYVGNINDFYLDFEGKSPFSEMDEMLSVLESPYKFFENSYWVKGIYQTAMNQGLGVVLNGGRGNFSISWGPALDYYALLLKRVSLLQLYYEMNAFSKQSGLSNKKNLLLLLGKKTFPRVYNFFNSNKTYEFPILINPDFAESVNIFKRIDRYGIKTLNNLNPSIYTVREEHFSNLAFWNTTGVVSTKLSLKYGVWYRDPTNDKRVIDFCLAVPNEVCVREGMDRALLRKAMKDILPEKVRLNQNIRGIQGADWIHRMRHQWGSFVDEIIEMNNNPMTSSYLNKSVIKDALEKVKKGPNQEYAFDAELRAVFRLLITYKFLKKYI